MEAAGHFEQAFDSAQGDVAMYWRAHALYKANRQADAARQVLELERTHPASHWLNEARALQIEYQGAEDEAVAEDELRLFALSRLMERDPEIQRDLIYALGTMGATEELHDLYPGLTSTETRMAAIEEFAIAGDQAMLKRVLALQVARTKTDPELRQMAIQVLGVMGATVDLTGLYDCVDDLETRKMVLEAMMIAGDTENLMKALETEQDPELKVTAIHGIAIGNERGTADFLFEMLVKKS